MKKLLAKLGLDDILGVDFETYYADDYSLRKMSTTEYIIDPRFTVHMASVRSIHDKRARVLDRSQFAELCRSTDWGRTGMLAHHCHFDGLIMFREFGVAPAMYLDTLSMGRPLMPIDVGGSLKAMCQAFGREAKQRAAALHDVKGIQQLSPEDFAALAAYAADDIDDTWFLFRKLLPYTPIDELRVIDTTVRMYAQPKLHVDSAALEELYDSEVANKETKAALAGVTKDILRSTRKFAAALESLGVEVPYKVSPRTGKMTYAFAKTDGALKAMLKHPDPGVRALVEARLANSSSILETRAARLRARSVIGAQPVYLNYWGAKTGRWSGSDKMNWQNFNRGSSLRSAIHAPRGHMLVIADQAQIEARINAWFAGQHDVVDAFAEGKDVYAMAASAIYNRPINKVDNPHERFVGKVCVLALGYQAGAARFADMLKTGTFGPPVDIPAHEASNIVSAWRVANASIVNTWRQTEAFAKDAFLNGGVLKHGVVRYEGSGKSGFMHLPNGTSIRYDDIKFDDTGHLSYQGRSGNRVCMYGGLLVENRTQALARALIAWQLVEMRKRMPYMQIVCTTHDEIVGVVKKNVATQALDSVREIMTTPPVWAPDLPLAVDSAVNEVYEKP